MGNRHFGDDLAGAWENQPDLSRKLYCIHYPAVYLYKENSMKTRKKFRMPPPANNANVTSKWTITVLVSSFIISLAFSAVTSVAMADLNIIWAFLILFLIIGINVLFDVIGTSVLAAEEYPFHSLAARKVPGAKQSIRVIRLAPQVASVCCDIIGDIAGIISGAATTIIISELATIFGIKSILPSLLLTGLVASLTIGGKAVCKGMAMQNGNAIVFIIGRIMHFLHIK